MHIRLASLSLLGALTLAACGPAVPDEAARAAREPGLAASDSGGRTLAVADTLIAATLDAAGVAEPYAQATLSTKLMGTVTHVLVREGDRVAAGQPLVRIDSRDVTARQSQASAGLAEAEAVQRDAATQLRRMRALYDDSAATRVQLEQAETGLARADAAVRSARAAGAEAGAMSGYAVVRAPFAGTVTQRLVDPGAFAAPGAPLVTVQDGSRLRVSVSAAPEAVRALRRGDSVAATVEREPAVGVIEGVVPAPGGSLYTVNAVVDNRGARFLPGSAASLALSQGERRVILVPEGAVRREGELTGVLVRGASGPELRWVRLGRPVGELVEVVSGLRAGERIVVPAPRAAGA